MNYKNNILNLKNGERYIVPESDYGRAEVWKENGRYKLYSIPIYGGEPQFEGYFNLHEIDKMIYIIENWT